MRVRLRGFIGLVAFVALSLSGPPASGAGVVHIVDAQAHSSTILVPGLTSELKVLQITDAHISLSVAGETNMMKYAERMHRAYLGPQRHFRQDIRKTTFEHLDDVLQKAKDGRVELLLLTGDILNFPSPASVDYVVERLKQTGIPWLYIAGNHDWHYEGLEGSLNQLRATWTERSLSPLYQGRHPLFYSVVIKGINFVGIDNSTGAISREQVEFLKKQMRRNKPIIVLSHIPYSLDGAGGPLDLGALITPTRSQRGRIIAVFAGHTHRPAYVFNGDACQYVSLPCFQGASFVAEIKAPAR
jgi:predicted MPP superfamily phosphohydrolase